MAAAAEMEKMSVEQVKAVKEQADMEVNILQDSLNNIRTATSRLEVASSALEDLSLRPKGKKLLVPLTASLYVPGTLDDADKVLVDVGTGYFIEKTTAEGKDYCDRKINLLRSNFDQLVEVAAKKKSIADEAAATLKAIHFIDQFTMRDKERGEEKIVLMGSPGEIVQREGVHRFKVGHELIRDRWSHDDNWHWQSATEQATTSKPWR
ncbi:hypothetical protein CMV_028243 [Castanea mollissima]|uniref:Prefoldin subunit 5 n=1 Tax=Castanea mollissima TaxID=60419 RepID=A0A8J4V594_9ROSI|nr:hypothetical protein CMV_028243 [Castanea mollissima]